jgi:hypothetical protein
MNKLNFNFHVVYLKLNLSNKKKTDELTAKYSDEKLQTFGFFVRGNGKCLNQSNERMLGDRRRRQKTYLAAIKAKALIYADVESTLSYLIQVEFEASKRNLTLFFSCIFNFRV